MKHLILSAFIAGGVCLALFFADSALETWTGPDRLRAETEAARANIDAERGRTENVIRLMETENRLRLNDRLWNRIEADHSYLIFGLFSLAVLSLFLFFRLYQEVRRVDYLKGELKQIENLYRLERHDRRLALNSRPAALIAQRG